MRHLTTLFTIGFLAVASFGQLSVAYSTQGPTALGASGYEQVAGLGDINGDDCADFAVGHSSMAAVELALSTDRMEDMADRKLNLGVVGLGRGFTVLLPTASGNAVAIETSGETRMLQPVSSALNLKSGTMAKTRAGILACFDLPQGASTLALS